MGLGGLGGAYKNCYWHVLFFYPNIQRVSKIFDSLIVGLMAPGDEVERPVTADSKLETLVEVIWPRVSAEFVDKSDFQKVLALILDSARPFELVQAAFAWPKRGKGLVPDPLQSIADLMRCLAEWQFRIHLGFAAQQDNANLTSKEFSRLFNSTDSH